MKKAHRTLCLFLVFLVSTLCFASAESFDLSGLSVAELISLRKKIDLLIMQSDEWKEVSIPQGEYIVGEDVPAGTYSITKIETSGKCYVDVYKGEYTYYHFILTQSAATVGKFTLEDGQTIKISYGDVTFAPYKGLGF